MRRDTVGRRGEAAVARYAHPADALAHEARLLAQLTAAGAGSACHIWSTAPCLVAPATMIRRPQFAVAAARSAAAGWPVHLRATGGGMAFQGPGVVTMSVARIAADGLTPSIDRTYGWLCAPILDELAARGHVGGCASVAGSFCDGAHNVVVDGRKLAGTAQRWRPLGGPAGGYAILAHALILVDADLAAAIAALNRFVAACEVTAPVRLAAHVNWRDLRQAPSPDALARRLSARLAARLGAAGASGPGGRCHGR